jgi:hypothetical protein
MQGNVVDSHCPATYIRVCKSSVTGDHKVLTTFGLVPSVVRHVKGSEEDLNQRINYYASNAGTDGDSLQGRWADHQCHNRGSEVIVVVEVTLHQGDGNTEHRAKGLRLDGNMDLETDSSRLYQSNDQRNQGNRASAYWIEPTVCVRDVRRDLSPTFITLYR